MSHTSKITGDVPGMLPRIVAALLLALVGILCAPSAAAAQPDPPDRPVCDWRHEYNSTLAELGEDPSRWWIAPLGSTRWGVVDQDRQYAWIDTNVKCDLVSSVVKHEWMHLQQGRAYGGLSGAYEYYGNDAERLEMAADCGVRILDGIYTPYLVDVSICPPDLQRNARELINYRR